MSYRPIVSNWRKSSKCEASGCVKAGVALEGDGQVVHVKDEFDQFLTFSLNEWRVFVAGVKNDEFDF